MSKKLTSLIAAAALTLCALPASAAEPETGVIGGADGTTDVYIDSHIPNVEIPFSQETAEKYGIEGAAEIYYNSQYLDPAIIINSRTMIPFRDFLEAIGAKVDYDEKTKTVTAVRNETEIRFSIGSDKIYIKNDLGEKEITMDVAPVVIGGNTYAPLRFLGESFAMQVDWSIFEQTALIVDYEKYFDELWEKCPNIMKLSELGLIQPERAASTGKADFAVHSEWKPSWTIDEDEPEQLDVKLTIDTNVTQAGTVSGSSSIIDFSYNDPDENSYTFTDASLDLIWDGETFYFKTDIAEKFAEINPDAAEAAERLKNKWFKISLEDYVSTIAAMSGSDTDLDELRALISNAQNPRALMEYQIKAGGSRLYGTYSVDMVSAKVKIIEMLDSFIDVTETGEDDYKITMKIDTEDFINLIINAVTLDKDEEESFREEVKGNDLEINLSLDVGVTDKITDMIKLNFDMFVKEEDFNLSITMNIDSVVDTNAEVEDIEIPADAEDIIEKIYGI